MLHQSTTTLVYDALGNRIEQNVNGTATYAYTNAFGEQVLTTKHVPTNTYSYNVYGLDRISEGGTASTSRTYYLTDGLGNVRYLTNYAGTVTASFTYDPYGKVVASTGTSSIFGFQSEQKDVQSGLTYLRARYYDPTTASFISQDPFPGYVDDPSGQNGYDYANGDPINLADPTGMAVNCDWGSMNGNYTQPNALAGYMHYLFGDGQSETMRASDISWELGQASLAERGAGVSIDNVVDASAQGFQASEHIGAVRGHFQGDIYKTQDGYLGLGSFTPFTDTYDFDIDLNRSVRRNAANLVGSTVGYLLQTNSRRIIRPTPYNIYFAGSAPINMGI